MAIIKNSIGIKIHGQIGKQFTVYERLGKTVMRSVPEGFRPTGEGQLAQQKRMKGCNTFYKAVRHVGLARWWNEAEKRAGWTGHNLFMHRNLPAFSERGWIEAPEKIRLTEGNGVRLPDGVRLERTEGESESWVVSWTEATRYPAVEPDDRAVVAVMRGGKYFDVKFVEIMGDTRRRDCRLEFVKPEKLKEHVYCYLYFESEGGKSVSSSVYLGILS